MEVQLASREAMTEWQILQEIYKELEENKQISDLKGDLSGDDILHARTNSNYIKDNVNQVNMDSVINKLTVDSPKLNMMRNVRKITQKMLNERLANEELS